MASNQILRSIFILLIASIFGCENRDEKLIYETDQLVIKRLTDNSYNHVTFLDTESYGKVACNGMVVIDGNEAIVIDSPTNDEASIELMNWLEKEMNCQVKAVVATHFHEDCVGGLGSFHKMSVPSYSNALTIELVQNAGNPVPENGFEDRLELRVGMKAIICEYLGEGHTKDNVIAYFPSEKILFGGCLVKSNGAGKGYLGDANIDEWANTVREIKRSYNDAEMVLPGHGDAAGPDLFDYTAKLFDHTD